jgi:hypothetical protein
MVVGIVVAVTGLLASFMWRDELGRHISTAAMVPTIIVAAAEFVLFLLIQWSIAIHNRSECVYRSGQKPIVGWGDFTFALTLGIIPDPNSILGFLYHEAPYCAGGR